MKFKIEFWNRKTNQQDEVKVEIDKSSNGFLQEMSEMRLEDDSFGLIDRTVNRIIDGVSKGETIHKITQMTGRLQCLHR